MVGKADVQVVDAICQAFSRKSVSAWVCLCAEQFAVYGMERNLQECLFGRIVIKKKGSSRIWDKYCAFLPVQSKLSSFKFVIEYLF